MFFPLLTCGAKHQREKRSHSHYFWTETTRAAVGRVKHQFAAETCHPWPTQERLIHGLGLLSKHAWHPCGYKKGLVVMRVCYSWCLGYLCYVLSGSFSCLAWVCRGLTLMSHAFMGGKGKRVLVPGTGPRFPQPFPICSIALLRLIQKPWSN